MLSDHIAGVEGMGSHGLMLGLQLLKEYRSTQAFLEAMIDKNGFYTDFECLHPLHEQLMAQVSLLSTVPTSNYVIF